MSKAAKPTPRGDVRPAGPIGVIDIGSNSVRLQIADVRADGQMEVLERASLPVRLGQDTFVDRQLSRKAMNAAISVLRGYREILDTYQVQTVRAVATSAVREASNADAFLDRVFMNVGLDVEILEPTEELRLTVQAVRDTLESRVLGRSHGLVIEVGGGSALLADIYQGHAVSSGSYALGSIRLQEALDTVGEDPDRVADMLRNQIGSVVTAVGNTIQLKRIRTVLALGGDARFVAQHIGQPGPGEHCWTIDLDAFRTLVTEVEHHSPEALARQYRIDFVDAETLVPALLVYQAVLERTNARKLLVSDATMRDGLLLDMARWATGQRDEEEASAAVRSATNVARKYHCDMQHAEHVARLSLRLFDDLQATHRLTPRHRLLLQVAAILHEVGGYINGRAHHKHSYYVIANAEVYGLRAREQALVANVARYHRRSCPKPSHLPYMALPRDERVVINKLAAILRIADALERGHSQQVADFTSEIAGDEFILHVRGVTDLALERRALEIKADLFEEVFGLHVRLEES